MNDENAAPASQPQQTAAVQATAPFMATLGIEVLQLDRDRAVLRIPDQELARNHMGGPHAGAIFTLGETAAASLMVQNFSGWFDRVAPLAVGAEIRWTKLARSAVTADARMLRPAAEIEAELVAGTRPEWSNQNTFRREQDGEICADMTVVLTLVPRRD
jgi:acyl-coenzyme A thioesterase PaaI-like protein